MRLNPLLGRVGRAAPALLRRALREPFVFPTEHPSCRGPSPRGMAEPGRSHRAPGALGRRSLRMQVTLSSCREEGCSPAPPPCRDSRVHLRLPSFPVSQGELREQGKCSHSVSVAASSPGPGDFLPLDFGFAAEAQLRRLWAGHLCRCPLCSGQQRAGQRGGGAGGVQGSPLRDGEGVVSWHRGTERGWLLPSGWAGWPPARAPTGGMGNGGELPAGWGFGSLPATKLEKKKKVLLMKKPMYFE